MEFGTQTEKQSQSDLQYLSYHSSHQLLPDTVCYRTLISMISNHNVALPSMNMSGTLH